MEHAKLANGSGHQEIGHFSRSAPEESCSEKSGVRPAAPEGDGQQVEIGETGLPLLRGAMTWHRVSSSGATADAASVSVNATGPQHGRGRRTSRSSSAPGREMRCRTREFRPLFVLSYVVGPWLND